ncbi:Tudor/PWWP/MBT superfamily protein [Raphanus sativus]|uniref:Sister chromatid cohesion protein PDS5 homolog D isoform X1 n=1 Tax=Raphanus sativus TaxID=3726 RepID=A0A9W3C3V2_RAPSA|nr:sister chromatid cohesion protein PDS5 homolog D isoform X1 [Raphanus sativus]KAJ4884771.1 Tudor/PWWP/MBT superfamily protein [Raphanus sativus]
MATVVGLTDLATSLIDAGNRLLKPPSSTDQLLALLDETESLLRDVGQDQPLSMQHALTPSKNALVQRELLAHPDSDVRVSLASCLTQIVRVAAPQAPYGDDQMKEIFRLTVEAFEKLADDASFSSRSYGKAEFVLDAMSRLNSCLVMLDLECHDLVLQMFRIFLRIIRSDHPSVVPSSMEMIMITVIDETDEVSTDLLDTLLTSVKKEKQNVSPMSWSLAEKVLTRCARTLQPYIIKAFKSTGTSLDLYSPVVSSICQTVFEAPKVHNAVNNTKENEDKVGGSKRPPREGTIRISSNDRVRKGNNSWSLSKHSLKQEVKSEGIDDGETDLRITGKRGRKPNSLMNPEEGYDVSWLSGKKPRRASSLSLGKVAAKKTPPSLTGSVKRSRVSIGESDHDSDEEADQERDEVSEEEDDSKIKNSSKKKKKVVSSSGKGSSARTYTKKKNKSYTDDFAESLVGQRVNIWWPLDKTFYEGVIKSYCSSKKMHLILYTDGEKEQLNLIKERWELLEDLTSDSEDMKKDSGQAREGENLKSLNAETDRREEQEDVNSQSEDEYYNGEKQEQSGNKSKEKLKVADVEGEAKEEEKEDAKSETESEREGSESGEEPEWRETEDEAEEVDDGKVRSKKLA